MGMSVDVYDYTQEVPKGKEEERTIEALGKQSVDPRTLNSLEKSKKFFEDNKKVADEFNQYRKKLFTPEDSTNDSNLRLEKNISRLAEEVERIKKILEDNLTLDIKNTIPPGDRPPIFGKRNFERPSNEAYA